MKKPRNLTAFVLGLLHLAFCGLFFGAYFLSPDSERGMALILFWFIDPWIRFFVTSFSGSLSNEVTFAVGVTLSGTLIWWIIGWLLGRVFSTLFTRQKEPISERSASPEREAGRRLNKPVD